MSGKEYAGLVSTREGFSAGLKALGEKHEDIYVLCADLSESTGTAGFRDEYPDRFIEMGISEQDMVGTAAGLALCGKVPFVSTYGIFLSGRAWDQVRNTVCYMDLDVKFGGAHGGISVGPDGATHQALEDIALMRVIPNMSVIVPSDAYETEKAVYAAYERKGPVYIRYAREKTPVYTKRSSPFEFGKGITVKQGKDIAIFACGPVITEVIASAGILKTRGIDCGVFNLHTIKPIDEKFVLAHASAAKTVFTVEEHQTAGGLGSAVSELLSMKLPRKVVRLGIDDRFGESGSCAELMKHFGLDAESLSVRIEREMIP